MASAIQLFEELQGLGEVLGRHGILKAANSQNLLKEMPQQMIDRTFDSASQYRKFTEELELNSTWHEQKSQKLKDVYAAKDFAKFCGIKISEDFFSAIEDEDLIEIYDLENTQIYRNFRFFEMCSYDLDVVSCMPWDMLYKRDENATQQIISAVRLIVGNEIDALSNPPIDEHQIREIYQGHNKRFRHRVKMAGVVRKASTNQVSGYATVLKVTDCTPLQVVN